MGLKIEYIEGQSPLDEDEKEGLLVKTISIRGELDEFVANTYNKVYKLPASRDNLSRETGTCPVIREVVTPACPPGRCQPDRAAPVWQAFHDH